MERRNGKMLHFRLCLSSLKIVWLLLRFMADYSTSSKTSGNINVKKTKNFLMASSVSCSIRKSLVSAGRSGRHRRRNKRCIKELTSREVFSGTEPAKESKIDDDPHQDFKLPATVSGCFGEGKGKPVAFIKKEIRKGKEKQLGIVVGGSNGMKDEDRTTLNCESHGMTSVIGQRKAMEDAVTMVPGVSVGEFGSYDFFAVYDGHGGARVANVCRDRMHQLLADELNKESSIDGTGKGLKYWEKVMGACFEKLDEEVISGECSGAAVAEGENSEKEMFSMNNTGSTAVVVMVGEEEVVAANCGDSRAVLYRGGMVFPLSHDHKVGSMAWRFHGDQFMGPTYNICVDRPDERERVESAGGRVVSWNGSRVRGVLATSRSIGDRYLKPYVISEPEVTVTERTESDEFIVIASDGLWDVVSNESACKLIRKYFDGQIKRRFPCEFNGTSNAAEAAALLTKMAMARGSGDNISVVVVKLKQKPIAAAFADPS